MLPLSALILLGTVCVLVSGTFVFAIYHTTKTRLEARRQQAAQAEADSDLRTPLRETAADPGVLSSRPPTPVPASLHPLTPEAEFPPPLPDEQDFGGRSDSSIPPLTVTHRVHSLREELKPTFLLPATAYNPHSLPKVSPPGVPTPSAQSPTPLPTTFAIRAPSPLPPPPSPLLPPPPTLPYPPKSRLPHCRPIAPQPQTERLAERPAERPDSMHEIYDIYSQLPPTPKVLPKSAPAGVTSFGQAESKWAYFGEKRAESRDREVGREREGGWVVKNVI